MLQYLEPKDLVLTPLFIAVIYFLANTFKARIVGMNSPLMKYFIPALSLKMLGAVASGLVYQYYYHGGDTMDFYTGASYIHDLLWEKPWDALALLTPSPLLDYPDLSQYDFLPFIGDVPTWTVVRTAAFVNFFSFDSYPILAIYFSLFSLYSSWKFFTLLSKIYPDPKIIKKFSYCLFYIPSVVFWGSGVFKDSLTLSGLFLFTYHIYQIVIKRKFSPADFFWGFIGLYLMYNIRIFFLIILIPCVVFWFFAEFRDKIIKSNVLKSVSFPFLFVVATAGVIFGLSHVMNENSEVSKTALKSKAEGFQQYHESLGGSAYSLDISDFSTASLIKVFPKAVNVTFFRPYVFETHSAFQMIDALQSLFFLYYFVTTLLRNGTGFFTAITQDAMVLFSFSFSIFYAFVAGFTSYNFGALDRYKIPALPFFMIALTLINYNQSRNVQKGTKS